MFNNFFSENRAVVEIMRENMVEQDRQYNMAHTHFMLDTYVYKNTHSEYVHLLFIN